MLITSVIPAKAGTQTPGRERLISSVSSRRLLSQTSHSICVPAFAGMSED